MSQLTIGQRIASQRKLLNLSQEALAEHLAVSRQAVSKRESDSTIPEIDKLIALGKLFGVSVGWILGVEDEGATSFSEAQMQMVEEVIAKCQPRKKRLLWRVVAIVCVLAVFIAAFSYLGQHISLLGAKNQASKIPQQATPSIRQFLRRISSQRLP